MINYILSYLTLVVLFIVQTTLGRYIDICGIAPNLVFVYILCYSMYNFPVRSAVLCIVAGIITDMYSMEYVGLNAILYMYIGLAISNFAVDFISSKFSIGIFPNFEYASQTAISTSKNLRNFVSSSQIFFISGREYLSIITSSYYKIRDT